VDPKLTELARKQANAERVTADESVGQAELAAERTHLVLEQFAQRLDQLHVHALRQATDIVVRLDRHRRAAGERHALDHVGIERALHQELGTAELVSVGLEHVDEQLADGLALRFRIIDADQLFPSWEPLLPLMLGVAMGASASFLSPFSNGVSLIVYGPGGYRFGDFWKLGLIVMAWALIVTVAVIPLYWTF
jgi:Sodium:sulfate symporter transmembrane region